MTTSVEFLQKFCVQSSVTLVAIIPDGATETRTFELSDVKALEQWISSRDGVKNLYWTVNPTIGSPTKKPTKDDISTSVAVWIDLDPGEGRSKESLRTDIERLRLTSDYEPSAVIGSGGGYQAFWRLAGSVPTEEGEALSKRLALRYGGDHVHNCDRVMRLPGTWNIPNAKKAANGRNKIRAELISFSDATYTSAQIKLLSTEGLKTISPAVDNELATNDKLFFRWFGDKTGLPKPSRSEFQLSVAGMVRPLIQKNELLPLLMQCPSTVSEKLDDRQIDRLWERTETDEPAVRDALDRMFADYVYIEQVERFYHPDTNRFFTKEGFKIECAAVGPTYNGKKNATSRYLNNLEKRTILSSLTYEPGNERIVEGKANTWRASGIELPSHIVEPIDIMPWYELLQHVYPEPAALKLYLDHRAFILQHPGEKVNWMHLVGTSAQGVGKDSLDNPIIYAIGASNVGYARPDEIADGWTHYMERQVVIVSEVMSFAKKEMGNKLKAWIARPPATVTINRKNIPQYTVPNIQVWVGFTNDKRALSLENEDRRFYVYWSPAKPLPGEFYRDLWQWYANGGNELVAAYLLQHKISAAFNPGGQAPMSESKREMIEESRKPVEQWLRDEIEDRNPPFNRDLLTIGEIVFSVKNAEELGQADKNGFNGKYASDIVKRIGAERLDIRPTLAGRRIRLWALRNVEKYINLDQIALIKAYGHVHGQDLGNFKDE